MASRVKRKAPPAPAARKRPSQPPTDPKLDKFLWRLAYMIKESTKNSSKLTVCALHPCFKPLT